MDIINELRNFAEDNKREMSVNVYNGIWNIIQSIEHEEYIKDRKEAKGY
jgi:hypothetical protein